MFEVNSSKYKVQSVIADCLVSATLKSIVDVAIKWQQQTNAIFIIYLTTTKP